MTAAALTGIYVSIVAMSWGSSPLLGNPITACFWFYSGMLAAMRRMEAEAAAPEEEELDDEEQDLYPAPAY